MPTCPGTRNPIEMKMIWWIALFLLVPSLAAKRGSKGGVGKKKAKKGKKLSKKTKNCATLNTSAQGELVERHQMSQIKDIMNTAKVSEVFAAQLFEVIMNEALLDWSECSQNQFKFAIKQAQMFIENGNSWDYTA